MSETKVAAFCARCDLWPTAESVFLLIACLGAGGEHMRKSSAVLAAVLLAGCAKAPESIAPSYVSDVGYQSWTCEQLGGEQMRISQALATASTQQRKARTNDTVGVIFLGLPVDR